MALLVEVFYSEASPTFFRYVDWILTVPLMCVEFYLILKVAGATKKLMWTLIGASVVMLVTGYLGEATPLDAALWGGISGAAYFYIVYLIMFGEAKRLATSAGGNVLKAHNILCKFILIDGLYTLLDTWQVQQAGMEMQVSYSAWLSTWM